MWLATLTRQMRSQASSGTSTPPIMMMPALAQNRSTVPNSSSVRATSAWTSGSAPASTARPIDAVAPSAAMSAATRSAATPSMTAIVGAPAHMACSGVRSVTPSEPYTWMARYDTSRSVLAHVYLHAAICVRAAWVDELSIVHAV